MDNQTGKKTIKEQIIDAAKTGKLKMKPKWYFILHAALWAVGIVVVSLALVYLASLFVFIAVKTGILSAPAFGWHGIFIFLASLPWMLIFLILVFAVLLEILARHYAFAYRMPLMYLAFGILLIVCFGGLLLAKTPLHEKLSDCPPAGGPPPCAMGLYRDLRPHRFKDVHKGTIIETAARGFIINDFQKGDLMINIVPQTRLPFGADFKVGDTIVIIGRQQNGQVEAFGIKKADF